MQELLTRRASKHEAKKNMELLDKALSLVRRASEQNVAILP